MRHSWVATVVAMMGLVSGCLRAEPPTAPPAPANTRYVYCNVYLTDVCFGLASGDVLKMELPADFVLRTVSLLNGAQAVIYEGNHPEDVFKGKAPKICPAADDVRQCQYTTTGNQTDVLYQAGGNSQMIHLRITGITDTNQAGVADFLAGFHRCKAVGQSEQCSNERPFADIH